MSRNENLPPEIKSRAFVYLRRSQNREDRQTLSIESQTVIAKQLIREHALLPIWLTPENRSAHYPGRPIFDDMMDRVNADEARYVVFWRANRAARNPTDAGKVIQAMDDGKLLAVITEKRVYRNTAEDKNDLWRELGESKKYSDSLSEDVKGGNKTKYALGEYPSNAFTGYQNVTYARSSVGDRLRRNIEPHPQYGRIVTEAFQYAATGTATLQDVYDFVTARGLHTNLGNPIAKSSVQDMLQRKAYTGVFKHNGWHRGTYTPLITMDLFEQVQVAMGWVKLKAKGGRSATSGRFYAYKGVPMCEDCGHNITAYTKQKQLANGEIAEYSFYGCTKKSKTVVCKNPQISGHELTEEIKDSLSDYEITEGDAAEGLAWLRGLHDDYVSSKNQYRPTWLHDKREAEKALDILDTKLETGVMTDERYQSRAAHHNEIIKKADKLLADSADKADRWLELASEVFSKAVNIGEIFSEANDKEKRQLMVLIGSNWTLGNKKVALTVREPLDALRHNSENPNWRARPDSNRRSSP